MSQPTFSVIARYMHILVLVFLSCNVASRNQTDPGSENKNTVITLAVATVVVIASKINAGASDKNT